MKAEIVKPQINGRSDFFSWQLYRWLKKYPARFYVHNIDGQLYIGDKIDHGFLHGTKLRQLCAQGAPLTGYAYGPCHGTKNAKDITEAFWRDYLNIGVCAIHGDYAHSWTTNQNERTCMFCKKQEQRTVEVRSHEVWA